MVCIYKKHDILKKNTPITYLITYKYIYIFTNLFIHDNIYTYDDNI